MNKGQISRIAFVAAAIFLSPCFTFSATIDIVVQDSVSLSPLLNTTVSIAGSSLTQSTNSQGQASFSNIQPGRYQVLFSHIGKSPVKKWVVISENQKELGTVSIRILMVDDPIKLPGVSVVSDNRVYGGKVNGSRSVLTEHRIAKQKALGSEELLRQVPGVTVAGDDGISNRLNIGIRGLYPRRSDRVLILEDGAPVQPSPYLAPSAYYNPPTDRIDIIEVVKGSAALTHGPHTMGGVINYITKQPPTEKRTNLKFIYGENGYSSTYLEHGGTWNNTGAAVQLLYKRGDGFRDNTAFDIYDGTAKLVWHNSSKSIVGAKFNFHVEDAQATYSALTQYEFSTDPHKNVFKDDILETERTALDITHHYEISPNTHLKTLGFYANFTRNWWRENSTLVLARTVDSAALAEDLIRVGSGTNRARLREFKVMGLQSDLTQNYNFLGRGHRLDFGARLEVDKFDNQEQDGDTPDARGGPVVLDERFRAVAGAFFVRNVLKILPSTSFIPGFRVESFNQRRDTFDKNTGEVARKEKTTTEFLPGATLEFEKENMTLFAGVHRGFTPPLDETAYFDDAEARQYDQDGDLDSELSWNYEIGARAKIRKWLKFEPAFFQIDIENMIAAGRNAVFDNLGKVRYRGFEAAAAVDMSQILRTGFSASLTGQWTYLDTKIKEGIITEQLVVGTGTQNVSTDIAGNAVPYAPRHSYRVGIELGFFEDRLSLLGDYNFVDDQFSDFHNTVKETNRGDNGLLPSYHFINLGSEYKLSKSGFTIFASVKNIENEIYRASRLHRASSGIFPGGFRQFLFGFSLPVNGLI